ncbi:MAG: hypothetical protein KKD44_27530 [Proteobacteria bacterium]|nr:hypothetical protein [Pseudomonadota bacterium]
MNEILKKAIEELNQEGKLNGLKITEKGKIEVEEMLKHDGKSRKIIFNVFWKKLENDFYELSPREFALKLLKLEKLLKKSGIDLFDELN